MKDKKRKGAESKMMRRDEMTGQQIKNIRNYFGDTQEGFAHRIGTTFSTVSRWELGKAKPSRIAVLMIRKIVQENTRNWKSFFNEQESNREEPDKGLEN